jgi:hypothetical protein
MKSSEINISQKTLNDWQKILDYLCNMSNIPSALIMRVYEERIEVCVSNSDKGSPYKVGDSESLKGTLYCEEVIKTQNELLVSNALKDAFWDSNPDIALGMISYCGLPLNWPNGVPFGTVCLLDNKENNYTEIQRDLLHFFKLSIESNLSVISEHIH